MRKARGEGPEKIAKDLQHLAVPIDSLDLDPNNAREHNRASIDSLKLSLSKYGQQKVIVVDPAGRQVTAGNGTLMAALELGWRRIAVSAFDGPQEDAAKFAVVDNATQDLSTFNEERLRLQLTSFEMGEMKLLGFENFHLHANPGAGNGGVDPIALAERFGVPPFSVLDARQGYWQDRKRAWIALGIRSELGRGENLLKYSDTLLEPDPEKRAAMQQARPPGKHEKSLGEDLVKKPRNGKQAGAGAPRPNGSDHSAAKPFGEKYAGGDAWRSGAKDPTEQTATGTSIFDPVLCELAYRWFSPPGGKVLDPFSGGSVRGVVAALLGRSYQGFDLSAEQVKANKDQWPEIFKAARALTVPAPQWKVGDSSELVAAVKRESVDFVFSCPPYADLERYSDDPRDLSTMSYEEFVKAYRAIVKAAVAALKKDRFALFVVGDVRDQRTGIYRAFIADTVRAFTDAGAGFYNDAVLVTAVGSLPIRAGKMFEVGRKLGKTHQNVLVFVKGDPRKATAACGTCDFGFGDAEQAPGQATEFGEEMP